MRCPACGHEDDKVIDSRAVRDGQGVRRRRECSACRHRFTTYEFVEQTPVLVVKKDGRREPYARERVLGGLIKACEKRPVSRDQHEELLANIVCVDASGIAADAAIDFMGSEGGVEVASVGAGISAPLVGAAAKVCDQFTVENVVKVAANKDGVQKGFDTAQVQAL